MGDKGRVVPEIMSPATTSDLYVSLCIRLAHRKYCREGHTSQRATNFLRLNGVSELVHI